MKNLFATFILLLSINAHAYVFCSDAVYCPTAGNLSTCYPTGSYLDWWSIKSATGTINSGAYNFTGAYNVKSAVGYFSACTYRQKTVMTDTFITLINTQGDLLAYNNGKNGWRQSGDASSCESMLDSCPFVPVSAQK